MSEKKNSDFEEPATKRRAVNRPEASSSARNTENTNRGLRPHRLRDWIKYKTYRRSRELNTGVRSNVSFKRWCEMDRESDTDDIKLRLEVRSQQLNRWRTSFNWSPYPAPPLPRYSAPLQSPRPSASWRAQSAWMRQPSSPVPRPKINIIYAPPRVQYPATQWSAAQPSQSSAVAPPPGPVDSVATASTPSAAGQGQNVSQSEMLMRIPLPPGRPALRRPVPLENINRQSVKKHKTNNETVVAEADTTSVYKYTRN